MMGKLLARATNYLRDEQDTVRRVKGALIYPASCSPFAVTTTIFLLAFVLPKFTAIYAQGRRTSDADEDPHGHEQLPGQPSISLPIGVAVTVAG